VGWGMPIKVYFPNKFLEIIKKYFSVKKIIKKYIFYKNNVFS